MNTVSDTYVNKIYGDGDKDIYLPYWRQVVQKEMVNAKTSDLEVEKEKRQVISEDEIALKHPKTGATFKLCDDGAIEMFVNADTGIRLDPKDNAIIFYGDAIHMATKETRIHTKPYGFIWNNYNINPYLYYGDQVNGQRYIPRAAITSKNESGQDTSKTIPIFQEQKRKQYYDSKVNDIISSMGIESPSAKRGV